ncbi:MAG: hypothetical protein ACLGIO_04260 [Acidimicrobiia bacterium]
MTTTHDELEARLASLFREQAEATPVPPADWTELRPVGTRPNRSNGRLVLAAAAVVAAVLAAVVVSGGDSQRVRTGPADETDGAAPTTTTAVPAAFQVETRQVSLSADAVAIDAGGLRFATAAPVQVHSDPGIPKEYTTLELTWREHGVEMRLFVYFSSDGRDWWSDEIRTYDGRVDGEWITYRGDFFRRPLGTPFVGDFEVSEPAPGTGRLRLSNARLEAFRRLPSCDAAGGTLVLDPGASPVEIPGPRAAYGVNVNLLEAPSCSVVADQDRYRYEWASRDPAIVTVDTSFQPPGLGTRHGELRGERPGTTSVVVTAVDPATGAAIAEVGIPVVVGEASIPTGETVPPAAPTGPPPPITVPAPAPTG